jgi:hypothetical protein
MHPLLNDTDPDLLQCYIAELDRRKVELIQLTINLLDLTLIISALHLALRHPHLPPSIRGALDDFLNQVVPRISEPGTALREVLERGRNPQFDEVPAHADQAH